MIHADTLKIARRFILRFNWKKTFAGTCLSLSKWLKDEVELLSKRPEIAYIPMLKGIDLSSLDCTLTMKTRMNPVAQDLAVTVPREVKKGAKRSK